MKLSARWYVGPAVAGMMSACSPAPATPRLAVESEAPAETGPNREFAYVALDGTPVTTRGVSGRMTLVGFVATYDIGSQAQARFINEVVFKHKPRINAMLLVLEPPDHRPLVEAFARSLDLRYPVIHADGDTTAGRGAFPGLHHVPSVVLLDRDGREVWRNLGLVESSKLSEVITSHDPR